MRLTRSALVAAGTLALACTEPVATEPRLDQRANGLSTSRIQPAVELRHEPVDYMVLAERAFNSKAKSATDSSGAEKWDASESRYRALSVVSDLTAPRSAPSVMQVRYERGIRGGETLASVRTALRGSPRQFYASLWLKLSSTWRGTGDVARFWIAGAPHLTISITSDASGAPTVTAALLTAATVQVIDGGAPAALVRGSWHHLELVAKSNRPGRADGMLDLWVDGVQKLSKHSVTYIATGQNDAWQQVELAPTWGRSLERVSRNMYMWWDHVYVSGSSSTADPIFAAQTAATAASIDNAIFSDDFESGSLSQWQDGVDISKQAVITDSSLAHSGTHVLRITYPAGQGGGWLTRFFMPGYDSAYVRYWIRLAPNWLGSTALLDLRGSRVDNQWSSFGKIGVCPSGSDFFSTSVVTGSASSPVDLSFSSYYPGMTRQADGATCLGNSQGMGTTTYAASRGLTPGVWHKVEFWVKLNTIGQADAVQRMWLDGQLAGEWSGLSLRTDSSLKLNSLMLDASATAPQTEQIYVDDVQVLPALPATSPTPVATVSVMLNSSSLAVGQSTEAVATVRDANGNLLTGRTIIWSTADTTIAKVDSTGLVSAVGTGTVAVTATSEAASGSATLTVTPPPVASVIVTLNSPSVTVGQSTQAVATLRDANGTVLSGRTITWSSSSTNVATVNTTGYVTGVSAGSATITATSEGVSGGASLSVVALPPAGNVIFSEGFESGTLAAWQDGVDPSKQQVLNDASLAHSGTHVLQITYPANGSGGWLSRFFMPGYDSVYVSYWVRLEPGWLGGTKLIDLRGSRIDNQWSSFGKAGVCPTGTDFFTTGVTTDPASSNGLNVSFYTYYPGEPTEPDGVTCYGRSQGMGTTSYTSARTLTIGVWHKVEFWVKLNTVGQNNAEQRVWLDGQLAGQWTGFPLRTSDMLKLNSFTIDASGGSSQTQRMYVDDIQILTVMPASVAPSPAPVVSVAVTLNSPSLTVGQSTQAVATLRDASGNTITGPTLNWVSSNTAVATVSSTGLVTAVAAGTATITATSEGVTGSATMTVSAPLPAPVASVTVILNSPSLTVGQSTQATATLRDASGNVLSGRTVTWSSSSTSVATVSATGAVTAVSSGGASIVATSEGISGSAPLTVTPPPVASVAVTLSSAALTLGQAAQATAVLKDGSGNILSGRIITWSSSNISVATVTSAGVVTAVGDGNASIVATSEGISGNAALSVTDPVASVSVTLGASNLQTGQTTQATVVLKDVGGNVLTGRTVTWSSSNAAVATVTSTGLVTAIGTGNSSISASSEGITGYATLTVTASSSSSEPIYVPGQNTSLYYQDFETYSDAASFAADGWAPHDNSLLSAPAGSGYGGGKAAQVAWLAGTGNSGMDRGVPTGGEGRVAIFTFMYRTSPGFLVDHVGKKFAIMNLGDPNRVTTGLSGMGGAGAWDLNISGVFGGTQDIFVQPNVEAFLPTSVGEYVCNGNWHRITIRRTRSSSGTLPDGSIEIWVDGVKTHTETGLMLGTQPIFNIEFSGTWNNGSPQAQDEYFDNVRIWY